MITSTKSNDTPNLPAPFAANDAFCVFRCGDSSFAVPAASVRELRECPTLVSVHRSHEVLAGIAHVRNDFLPVLRLPALLNDDNAQQSAGRQILVMMGPRGAWALLIDQAIAIETLDTAIHTDVECEDSWLAGVVGTANFGNHVLRVLDPNTLYRQADDWLRSFWQADQYKGIEH
jgi:chemotaxis signal transduction protein